MDKKLDTKWSVITESKACAYLFPGAAMFFDDTGEQIPIMQKKGLNGLHAFVKTYPNASVYWAYWGSIGKHSFMEIIAPETIPRLLKSLKK